ncbi:MAG: hypothetical protein N2749_04795 [Clostridia bacterium]|nr:hypothetical protein [Clostridia bacterium]
MQIKSRSVIPEMMKTVPFLFALYRSSAKTVDISIDGKIAIKIMPYNNGTYAIYL